MEVFMAEQGFLTVIELAGVLKVKPSWIYGETRKTGPGTIPRIRVGKYLRFSLPEVLAWLKDQEK
jgi:predicted DNA-binding transcriptional regulator AlpA